MLSDRILQNLKDIVGQDNVSSHSADRITHSFDATQQQFLPEVVVHAVTSEQVSRIVRLANTEKIPILPRGAGSGFTGGSLPVKGGIVLVLTRMNRILEIDTDNLIAVVEPGVITGRLQKEVEKLGLFYPPDPASKDFSTLGGNIANASPAADTPPSLLAYGAELELVSVLGSRRVAYASFHQGYKQMDLAPDELVAKVLVPKPTGRGFHYFRKVGTRQAQAISKVCLAAYARLEKGCVAELRIGLGSVAPAPVRARAVEQLLLGQPLASLPIEAARLALGSDISPIDDIRATAHYRSVVTGNLLAQMLRELTQA